MDKFSADGLNASEAPASKDRFYVRRGRVKATAEGANTETVIQIDATGEGVVLKDAEASIVDTWTPLKCKLTVGQFLIPFGFEIMHSSSLRAMPERSRMKNVYWTGERDRGIRLTGHWQWLRLRAAVINGNGTQDAIYTAFDQLKAKDVVGRIGGEFKKLPFEFAAGVSGYHGPTLKTLTPTPGPVATYDKFNRTRVGVDAQLYVDVPRLGQLTLRGEFERGIDTSVNCYIDYGVGVLYYLGNARVTLYYDHPIQRVPSPLTQVTQVSLDKVTGQLQVKF